MALTPSQGSPSSSGLGLPFNKGKFLSSNLQSTLLIESETNELVRVRFFFAVNLDPSLDDQPSGLALTGDQIRLHHQIGKLDIAFFTSIKRGHIRRLKLHDRIRDIGELPVLKDR